MVIVVDNKNPFLADALSGAGEVRQLGTAAITNATLRDADAVIVRSETKVGESLLEGTPCGLWARQPSARIMWIWRIWKSKASGLRALPGAMQIPLPNMLPRLFWKRQPVSTFLLKEKTLGVVGVGNVGSRVVRVARALGMQVLQNDPPLARTTGDPVFVPLDAVMEADVVTLHVPLTRAGGDPTFHLFDRERFSRMKRGSILINTARGPVVDSKALHSALASGHLAGCRP